MSQFKLAAALIAITCALAIILGDFSTYRNCLGSLDVSGCLEVASQFWVNFSVLICLLLTNSVNKVVLNICIDDVVL